MQTKNSKIINSQLQLTAEAWNGIAGSQTPADRWLGNYFHKNRKKIGSRDRKFVSECVYSLFRHKIFYESWLKVCNPQDKDYFLAILAAGFEGLISEEEFSEKITGNKTHELFKALRNGEMVINHEPSSDIERLSVLYSFPEWLVARWIDEFSKKKCEALLTSFNERPPLVVRANTLKTTRHQLIKLFQKSDYQVSETTYSENGIAFAERQNLFSGKEFQNGFFEVQDEGSQLISLVMNPEPGDTVWDMCAGAGGKSLSLAAIMKNKGRILATDIRQNKMADLKKRAKRAGAFNIFPADKERLGETKFIKKGFDKILIDAPCSGTGTLRRNPDAKWKLKEDKFQEYQDIQVGLIEEALSHVKGTELIFYVTCSIEEAENEQVIARVLKGHPDVRVVPVKEYAPGIAGELCKGDYLRLWPDEHGMDGFFMAILRKNADT